MLHVTQQLVQIRRRSDSFKTNSYCVHLEKSYSNSQVGFGLYVANAIDFFSLMSNEVVIYLKAELSAAGDDIELDVGGSPNCRKEEEKGRKAFSDGLPAPFMLSYIYYSMLYWAADAGGEGNCHLSPNRPIAPHN